MTAHVGEKFLEDEANFMYMLHEKSLDSEIIHFW